MDAVVTDEFLRAYEPLDAHGAAAVNAMLERLELEHAQPQMRNAVRVGTINLWATPRFSVGDRTFRITWQYGPGSTQLTCWTLAEVQ